jgi:hypothetical protein
VEELLQAPNIVTIDYPLRHEPGPGIPLWNRGHLPILGFGETVANTPMTPGKRGRGADEGNNSG